MEARVINGGRRIAGGHRGARYGHIGLAVLFFILLAGANWAASRLSVLGAGGGGRTAGAVGTDRIDCGRRLGGSVARGVDELNRYLMKSKRPMTNNPSMANPGRHGPSKI